MHRPAVISAQKIRVCPRLSTAFLIARTTVDVPISIGMTFPIRLLRNGFGNTTGTSANASRSAVPQTAAEIGRRDIPLHDISFPPSLEVTDRIPPVTLVTTGGDVTGL